MMKDEDLDLDFSEEIAEILWQAKVLKFGKFELTSGKTSPYYVDLRLLPSYPKLFSRIASYACKLIKEKSIKADRICGVPTGGLPLATLIANKLSLPLIYSRQRKKEHGSRAKIEGNYEEGERILVVDDLITTGGSIIESIEALREKGLVVKDSFVILNRQEGGKRNLEEIGVRLNCLGQISPITKFLQQKGEIAFQQSDEVHSYLEDQKPS